LTIFHRLFEDSGISRQRLVVGCRGTAFRFPSEAESQHPEGVCRPDADAHRGAAADQPGQPRDRSPLFTRSSEIESCVGGRYCNQDRERGLQRVVYTGHCGATGNRQKELPFQVEPRVSICSRERERRFGSPDLWTSGLPTTPGRLRRRLVCCILQRTGTNRGDRSRRAQLPRHF